MLKEKCWNGQGLTEKRNEARKNETVMDVYLATNRTYF